MPVREFPHLSRITDGAVQDSLRLLWEKMSQISDKMESMSTEDPAVKQQIAAIGRVLERHQAQLSSGASGGGTGTGTGPTVPPSPPTPPGPTPPPGPGPGPPGVVVPHPGSFLTTIEGIDAGNPALIMASCISAGGSWGFMDACVSALRAIDPRFGYNGKRGDINDPSVDAVFYYGGPGAPSNGDTAGWIFDIIGSVCPPGGAYPAWTDVTAATLAAGTTGAYVYPRP